MNETQNLLANEENTTSKNFFLLKKRKCENLTLKSYLLILLSIRWNKI